MGVSELIIAGVIAVVTGTISGATSFIFSRKNHRQQKWWELKVSAYQNAIEALSDIVYTHDEYCRRAVSNCSPEKEDVRPDEELDNCRKKAFPIIKKITDSSGFLFSPNANKTLENFINEYHNPMNDFICNPEAQEFYLKHAKQCLTELINHSKTDLPF